MARVVVVGAGIAGLSAAVRLADFGHDVVVVEARPSPGGQLSTATVEGVDVDLGPSAFTLPAVFRDLFRKTGRPLERELDLVPVDPAVRFAFAGGAHVDVPNASRAGAMRAFDDVLGPGAGAQWDAVIQHGAQLWQRLRPHMLGDTGRGSLRSRARRAVGGRSPRPHDVARHVPDSRLGALLGTYAAALGEDPSRAPSTVTVLPYLEQTFGLWTVDGGPRRLVEALWTRAAERGATFRLGAQVTGLVVAGRRIGGVRLAGGETVRADVVVSAIQPARFHDVLGGRSGSAGNALPVRLLRRPPSGPPRRPPGSLAQRPPAGQAGRSTFSVVLVAGGGPAGAPGRTVVVPDGDQPAVTVHRGPELATTAARAWVLHAGCDPHGDLPGAVDWAKPGVADAYAGKLLDVVAASRVELGRVTVQHVRTPHDLERDFGAPGGCVHGVPDEGVTGLVRRAANVTRIRGLFLAGSGAHPGPGVPMAGISAAIVADLIGRA